MNKLDNNSKTILTICAIAALAVIALLVSIDRAKAGTAQPLPATTPEYPVICTDTATGKVTLVADGRKVRVAYWTDEKPYFTDSNRASRQKRTFTAPTGSVCRVGATEATVQVSSAAARG